MSAKPRKAANGRAADYAELWGRAEQLLPVLRERAAGCEELRRMPDETLRDLHDAGLFRMQQPRRVGGSEIEFAAVVTFGALLARACASSAWNLVNLGSHHLLLGMFPPKAQDDVWNVSADALIASSFVFPAGRAQRVEGGYQVSGRWPFSSGVDPSDWNLLAGQIAGAEGEPPEQRVFLLHKSQYKVHDTWFAGGLRGTGSKDVEVKDQFPQLVRLPRVAAEVEGARQREQDHHPRDGRALQRRPATAGARGGVQREGTRRKNGQGGSIHEERITMDGM
jgi:3-hydroxy-9,10-secoandrosta-1,3,5(10)-triene-9,17-dione monooxygenase